MKDLISIIIPCYNEEESLPALYKALIDLANDMPEQDFEFLFSDDGSKDGTLDILKKLNESDERIKYTSFSRNFGKEAGIIAGLKRANGDYVVIIDADLQHPPKHIKEMYAYIVNEGYDSVATKRIERNKGIRSLCAKLFYAGMNIGSSIKMEQSEMDFRMMSRKMKDAVLSMSEVSRFSKGIFEWVGFKTKWITFENVDRAQGKTKWKFTGLMKYAFDGFMSFSAFPVTAIGLLAIFFAVAAVATLLVQIFLQDIYATAKLYLFVSCIICFSLAFVFAVLWLISQYILRIFNETRKRPLYITNITEKDK